METGLVKPYSSTKTFGSNLIVGILKTSSLLGFLSHFRHFLLPSNKTPDLLSLSKCTDFYRTDIVVPLSFLTTSLRPKDLLRYWFRIHLTFILCNLILSPSTLKITSNPVQRTPEMEKSKVLV